MPHARPAEVPPDGLTTRQRRHQPVLAVHTGAGKGKSTAAFGMAQAVLALLARGNNSAASTIISAATLSGNATLATTVTTAVANSNSSGSLYTQGANSNPATTSTSCTTVSPTTPGGAC